MYEKKQNDTYLRFGSLVLDRNDSSFWACLTLQFVSRQISSDVRLVAELEPAGKRGLAQNQMERKKINIIVRCTRRIALMRLTEQMGAIRSQSFCCRLTIRS